MLTSTASAVPIHSRDPWAKRWFLHAGCPCAQWCVLPAWGEQSNEESVKDHPVGPGVLLTAVNLGLGKRAVLLLLRLAENGWDGNKDKLNHIEKSSNNLVWGRLWAPFQSFLKSLLCKRKVGGEKNSCPRYSWRILTPKIILFYKNWFCSFSFAKNNTEWVLASTNPLWRNSTV